MQPTKEQLQDANSYDELALAERCDGLRDARLEAIEDAERGDKLNPYMPPDPRFYAYETEFALWKVDGK